VTASAVTSKTAQTHAPTGLKSKARALRAKTGDCLRSHLQNGANARPYGAEKQGTGPSGQDR
jgi:hypothetical protein